MAKTALRANALWNLLAIAAPLPVALVAVPILIRGLGPDRFGLLALSWTLIGYCALFDLGLGRALTQLVAQVEQASACEGPAQFWTALTLMAILGAAGAALLLAAAAPLAQLLRAPASLQPEIVPSIRLVAAAIPLIIVTSGLRGFLEAHQKFAIVGPIRALAGALLLLGPVLLLPYARTLPAMLAAMVTVRALSLAAHFVACIRTVPELWTHRAFRWDLVSPLARFGGWLTVTNIVSPLMVSMDRFLIGAQLAVAAVAWYATPYEIVSKFLVLPTALVGVLFPAFSASLARDGREARRLYRRGMWALFCILAPLTLAAILLAKPALALWVGAALAQHSYRVLRILALGVFINGLAQIPFTFIQGAGRPDLTAKFHLLELPLYAAALWYAIRAWGIEGAAIAWVARATVDAGLLFWCSNGLQPRPDNAPAAVPGFAFDRQAAGSHEIWFNPDTNRDTTVRNHPGDLPEGTLRAILKPAGIDPADFLQG